MAKIHNLTIKNFRCLKDFSQSFSSDFICLIGRGDSGKSTILEAISLVLSPNKYERFYDNDFYNCDVSNPIEIEVSISDFPNELINVDKFGLHIRGLDANNNIHDELEDDHVQILTIKLIVESDLEPKWFVVNGRQEPKPISYYYIAKLNVFIVTDYLERHFSWTKGGPLYALLQNSVDSIDFKIISDVFKELKEKIDNHPFDEFKPVVEKIKSNANLFGIDISNISSSIDFKDVTSKENKISLHEEKIPLRLKGKGTKRLISMAIQLALSDLGSINLIDEIEQGLEPDRVQHLVSILRKKNKGQIFVTTHSSNVIQELEIKDIMLMKAGNSKLITFDLSLQGCIRKNPDSFFAQKVIVCEGPTEVGIIRALNNFRLSKGLSSISLKAIKTADGSGDNAIEYSKGFHNANYITCLFCDSDNPDFNSKKTELLSLGITVIDWENNDNLEMALFKYLPCEAIIEILQLASEYTQIESGRPLPDCKRSIFDSIKDRYPTELPSEFSSETLCPELRNAMATSCDKNKWFKRIYKSEVMGNIIFKHFDKLEDNRLKQNLELLHSWIDDDT